MPTKLYENFYDCIIDLGNVLGVSRLDDMEAAILFASQNGFPKVADYLKKNMSKLRWNVRKEFEDVDDANTISS